ncbi:MAG: methyltransferase [Clostridia bacterium]|nr:methyltransferase [Clostridia bacterium]
MSEEHIEHIGKSLRLIVSERYTFGTDALLLASFSAPKFRDAACDFGTGCGVIPFYWLGGGLPRACAVELQEDACEQLRRSVALNSIEERLTLLQSDLRELNGRLPPNHFDLITMNPPYTPAGKGVPSREESARIARHETALTPEELFAAAAKHLKFGGRMCVCQRPDRLTETLCAMRGAGIEPKRLRFVAQREGKAPWLFLLEGKRGRNPGMTVEPELHMETPDGSPSPELKAIYGDYAR